MFKAAFIDMDGTMLTKSHTISDSTIQTFDRLSKQGILIVPISARPLHGMMHIIENVISKDTPIVSLNGGYIYHHGKIIYQINIPSDKATLVHNAIDNLTVSAMYYTQMDWHAKEHTDAITKEQKITPVSITIQPFGNTLSDWEKAETGPNKILIAGNEQLILLLEKQLISLFGDSLNIYKSQPKYLELMHPDASKTKAMQLLMQHYGLQQHEIVAIGDNYNDKGMIEFAGAGVAMGNAPAAIKAVANYVTDTNNNDGVAKALVHYFG